MNARAVTTDVLLGIVPIALLVALWQAIASFGYAPASLLPPPGLVFMRLAQQLVTGTFQHEIGATLFRLFAGFSIAVFLGVRVLLSLLAVLTVGTVRPPSSAGSGVEVPATPGWHNAIDGTAEDWASDRRIVPALPI